MKNLLWLIFGLFSCNYRNEETTVRKEKSNSSSFQIDTTSMAIQAIPIVISDTIRKFIVDDYTVTYEMFNAQELDGYSSFKKKSGKTQSFDKAWFTNDKLNQTLVFELYTDGHRLVTYHFKNEDFPSDIINMIELHTKNGDVANNHQKTIDFKGFLSQSKRINEKYFKTKKGIILGDSKGKIIEIYGLPDAKSKINGIEKLEWSFIGDILYDGKQNLNDKPLAKDNYGHQVYLFFKNEKLIGQILHNDIP